MQVTAAAAAAAEHSYEQKRQPNERLAPPGTTDHLTTICTAGFGQEVHVQDL